jgi:serine/threonine protein kinase
VSDPSANDHQGPWEGLVLEGGRYGQLKTIGLGGMGCVYRAVDRNFKTYVVIKTPRSGLVIDASQTERFEREIAALVRFSFPYIVPVLDVGRHDGTAYAVMRYLSGKSLASRIQSAVSAGTGGLPIASLRDWLPNIVKALDYIHRSHYVHRDVKPDNILFDGQGQAYLGDFGIAHGVGARQADEHRHSTSDGDFVLGSVDYIAPELLSGDAVDHRADQYSLAVTIFESLAGRPPFPHGSIDSIVEAHLNHAPPELHRLVSSVPRAASNALKRALAKRPEERFESCRAFVQAMFASSKSSGTGSSIAAASESPAIEAQTHTESSNTNFADVNSSPALKVAAVPGRDTERIPLVARTAASQAASSQPAVSARRKTSRMPLLVGGVIGLAALIGVVALMALDLDDSKFSQLGANPLPRRLSEWKRRADAAEKSLSLDAGSLLKKPTYADSAGFEALLGVEAAKRVAVVTPELELLTAELNDMALTLDARRKAIASPDAAASEMDERTSELRDQESQLLTSAHQLRSLRQKAKSFRGVESPDAVAELSILRDMESVAKVGVAPQVAARTLERADALRVAGNEGLAQRAWNVLLRAADPRALAEFSRAFDAAGDDRQAAMIASLLVAGTTQTIDAAAERVRSRTSLFERLDQEPLLTMFEASPEKYRTLFDLLAGRCRTADVRFRLALLQLDDLTRERFDEIKQSCRTGLLRERVGDLIAKIVVDRRASAYKIAETLLTEHAAVRTEALETSRLVALEAESPRLAGLLGEAWLLGGTKDQRTAAAASYAKSDSKLSASRLVEQVNAVSLRDPSELVNAILPHSAPQALNLAEQLLGNAALKIEPVDYAAASEELLQLPKARKRLCEIAWTQGDEGRGWTIRALLGADFARRWKEAEAERDRQLQALDRISAALIGRTVSKPASTSSVVKSLTISIPRSEVSGLTADITAGRWAPESEAIRNVEELLKAATAAKTEVDEPYRKSVSAFVDYLERLQQLNGVAYRMAGVYDLTISQQLPGALRGIKLKNVNGWDFIVLQSHLDVLQREESKYRELATSLLGLRKGLTWSAAADATMKRSR